MQSNLMCYYNYAHLVLNYLSVGFKCVVIYRSTALDREMTDLYHLSVKNHLLATCNMLNAKSGSLQKCCIMNLNAI